MYNFFCSDKHSFIVYYLLFAASVLAGCSNSGQDPEHRSSYQKDKNKTEIYPEINESFSSDTVIVIEADTFEIKIIRSSLPKPFVKKEVFYEHGAKQIFFRNWKVDLTILKNRSPFFEEVLTKESFKEEMGNDEYLNNTTLINFWIADITDKIVFTTLVGIPETDDVVLFSLDLIDGELSISEIDIE
ncbi:MAG: DUF4738 domain-containing protein [Bacteroidota bacterium]